MPREARAQPIEVVWEAPPEARRPSMYRDALVEVKARPGKWARVRIFETSSGAYSARKTTANAAGKDPRWELRVAPIEDTTTWGLWIRYRDDEQMKAAAKKS